MTRVTEAIGRLTTRSPLAKYLSMPLVRQPNTDRLRRLAAALLIALAISGSFSAESKKGQNHWAWEPIQHPAPPAQTKTPAKTPIDQFIFAKLEQKGLAAARRAAPLKLLRRVTVDLTGLPPAPAEVEAFAKGDSAEDYAKRIDRLLESPQYGERWARHWLDLVRFADTGGFEKDLLYRNAWAYRDYVIRAFNSDKPFDRFIEEQIAGDELWPDDPDAVAATGLYAVGPASQDSALNSTQLEYEWLTDSVDTTGAAFLGMTLGCARCHNHKYDPITQQDYFAMQAVFAASDRPYPAGIRENRIKGLNGILADVPIPKEVQNDPRCTIVTDDKVGARLFHRDAPMEIRRLARGELSKPKEIVEPAIPALFHAEKVRFEGAESTKRRRATFAKWVVSRDNPLTARVIVNRVWTWHFGQGLVRTPNDFGAQGEAPTHPELLDWLANDFVEHGWDLKRLHRMILTSATYQMDSVAASNREVERDSENRLLSRFPRRRLTAEAIWDSLHACAGTLNLKTGGPPVVPALSQDELSGLFGDEKWKVSKDETEHNRRAIYLLERRAFLVPMIDAFDPPDVMSSCPQRFQTTVPTQALALLNSSVALEQARHFAQRLLKECAHTPEEIPRRAWLIAFGRPITKDEADKAAKFLASRQNPPEGLQAVPANVAPESDALTEFCLALFNANEFVFID
jgi:hypothetical protein